MGNRSAVLPGAGDWGATFNGADFRPANLGIRPDACDPTAPSGPHPGGILIALADGSVRLLSAAGATTRLGSSPAAYDEPPPATTPTIAPKRGWVWSALVTPDGGEIAPLD